MPQPSAAESTNPLCSTPPSSPSSSSPASVKTHAREKTASDVRGREKQPSASLIGKGRKNRQLQDHDDNRTVVGSASAATNETGFGGMLRKASRKLGFGDGGMPKRSSGTRRCDHEGASASTVISSDVGSDDGEAKERRSLRQGSDDREGGVSEMIISHKKTSSDSAAKTSATRHSVEYGVAALSSSGGDGRGPCTKSNSSERPDKKPPKTTNEKGGKSDADRKASSTASARSNSYQFNLLGGDNPLRKLSKLMGLNRASVSVAPPEWKAYQELSRKLDYFPRGHNRSFTESYVLGDVLGAGGFAEVKSGARERARHCIEG